MSFIRIYLRVLGLLRSDARLAVTLALANIVLAGAQFVEPVLFGRIVDALVGRAAGRRWRGGAGAGAAHWRLGRFRPVHHLRRHAGRLVRRPAGASPPQPGAGGLFRARAAAAARLSFRRAFRPADEVMLTGTDTLWWLWVSFFREHFAAFVFIVVLLPASLVLNWRLALPLLVLCVAFTALTVLVMHKAYAMQRAVERHYSDLAETAADALGNVALVQSYARIELEVSALKTLVNSLLRAQMPVLSWWALAAVLTRAGTTLTLLVILLVGTYLKLIGLASVGEIVSFMSIAALLITRLEQAVSFANRLFLDAPKLADFFDVLDTVPAVRDRPDAVDPGRVRGLVEFNDVSFSYDGKRSAVTDLTFTALPGDRVALVGPTGSGKSTALALLHRAFDPQSGIHQGRRHGYPRLHADRAAPQYRRRVSGDAAVQPLDRGEPARRQADATDAEMRDAAARAQALDFIDRNAGGS